MEWGIGPAARDELDRALTPLTHSTSPFADRRRDHDVYVEPSLSAEIRYLEVTSSGVLRHATFRQLGGRWSR